MKLLTTVAAALITLCAAPASFSASSDGPQVSVETTTVGSVGRCDLDVQRSVSVCTAQGDCRLMDLQDDVAFRVPEGGSFTISASAAALVDGVVQGSGVSDRFSTSVSRSLIQTLEASTSCSFSFSYDITVR